MYSPFSPLHLLLFILSVVLLFAVIQLELINIAFERLELSSTSAFMLLATCLFGSPINLPLFRLKSAPNAAPPTGRYGLLRIPSLPYHGYTLITINVGGGLVPVAFSLYLLAQHSFSFDQVMLTVSAVSAVSYFVSRPMPGIGIGMPLLVAPLTAALSAMLINQPVSAPLAYIGGTLGVLIGADLLRLRDIARMAIPAASIGGAGTFDGIFLTGFVAVLLA